MALPNEVRQLNTFVSTTLDEILPDITDNFFQTNALWVRLYQRARGGAETVRYLDGGDYIDADIIYAGNGGGSYGKGGTFDTALTEFMTQMQFPFRYAYSPINLWAPEIRQNAGRARIFSIVEAAAKNAVLSLSDIMGYMIFGTTVNTASNSTGATVNSSIPTTDFDGLYDGVLATGTYGGITRGAAPVGSAINAVVNSVGGPFSLSMVQSSYGAVTFTPSQPDLIVTTQPIWNKWWDRVQTADRNPPGPLRDVGFRTIRFNDAEVIADAHCPSGYIYLLNTEFIQLCLLNGADFVRRGEMSGFPGGFPVPNQDATIDQLIVQGNFIIPGPRFQAVIQNVS